METLKDVNGAGASTAKKKKKNSQSLFFMFQVKISHSRQSHKNQNLLELKRLVLDRMPWISWIVSLSLKKILFQMEFERNK